MSCNSSCNQGSGAFCAEKKTWTPCCGTLQETTFPENYEGPNGCITGYEKGCGCGSDGNKCNCKRGCNNPAVEPYYHTLTSEWKTSTNVTPANHDFRYDAHWWKKKNKTTENYTSECCNGSPMDYARLKGTWSGQKRYTLG